MILRSLIIVAVLIGAVLAFAATRPDTILIERSLSIKAPPEKIFALINNFQNWARWAPQDTEDPSMKRTFSGPESGTGAISDWNSTGSAGRGRMLITESVAPNRISVDVDWVKPFKAHNVNLFSLEPDGASTRATWSMRGKRLHAEVDEHLREHGSNDGEAFRGWAGESEEGGRGIASVQRPVVSLVLVSPF